MSPHLSAWLARLVVVGVLLSTAAVRAQTMELTEPMSIMSFRRGSAEVTPAAREQLSAAIQWLHAHPWRLIVIEGYGDSGRPTANVALAQDRVDAVRRALLDLGGDPKRIVDTATGETRSEDGTPARGRVLIRGTLGDFRDLVASQRGPSR